MTLAFSFFSRLFSSAKESPNIRFLSKHFSIKIRQGDLYELALTHRSSAAEKDNERLELLGDAVLDLVVADFLFQSYPNLDEGELTKLKSKMISRDRLILIAMKEGFGENLDLIKQKDLDSELIIGNVIEAIFGAMYVDQGYAIARTRAIDMFKRTCDMEALLDDLHDPKSLLLEWSQKNRKKLRFMVAPHADDAFKAKVLIEGEPVAQGVGSSKKRAEKAAARNALSSFDSEADQG